MFNNTEGSITAHEFKREREGVWKDTLPVW